MPGEGRRIEGFRNEEDSPAGGPYDFSQGLNVREAFQSPQNGELPPQAALRGPAERPRVDPALGAPVDGEDAFESPRPEDRLDSAVVFRSAGYLTPERRAARGSSGAPAARIGRPDCSRSLWIETLPAGLRQLQIPGVFEEEGIQK